MKYKYQYTAADVVDDKVINKVDVVLIATNEKEARKEVERLCKRSHYQLVVISQIE